MFRLTTAAIAALLAGPVSAEDLQGDAITGAQRFDHQCTTCHMVRSPEGEMLAGRASDTGPNLYGVIGGGVAGNPSYSYGEALASVGAQGLVWDQAAFVAYVQDPTDWLRMVTGDRRARSKMSYRVRLPQDAYDIFAYLTTLAPQ
jgi:cytochrome c